MQAVAAEPGGLLNHYGFGAGLRPPKAPGQSGGTTAEITRS